MHYVLFTIKYYTEIKISNMDDYLFWMILGNKIFDEKNP